MIPFEPLMSVVVTSRNDNHGGTLLRRMQTFTNHFIGQCKRHGLNAELVIVEWNPPDERARLVDALHWPSDLGPCQVRIIEVSPGLHGRFKHSDSLPLFQMIAKNVGIRRSHGNFILATNIDILFSDELMQFIIQGKLRSDRMYRVDRMDVMTEVPVDAGVEDQLAFCRSHYLRRNAREGSFRLELDGGLSIDPDDVLPLDGSIVPECGLMPIDRTTGLPLRWVGPDARLVVTVPPGNFATLILDVEPGPGVKYNPFDLYLQDAYGETIARAHIVGRQRVCAAIPLTSGQAARIVCHVPEGGFQARGVVPLINFCLYNSGWHNEPLPPPEHPRRAGNVNCAVYEVGSIYPDDIAQADSGILFGRGFYPPCTSDGERFRWAAREAVLLVRPPKGASRRLSLLLEDGPSLTERPFHLEVYSEDMLLLARATLEGRQRLELDLPVGPEEGRHFLFRVLGDVTPLGDDKNYWLCYRVLECDWKNELHSGSSSSVSHLSKHSGMVDLYIDDVGSIQLNDVAPSGSNIRFGRGFSPPETWNEERMRWVGREAVLIITPPEEARVELCILIEDSPTVKDKPLVLEVCDRDSSLLARTALEGRHRIRFALPLKHRASQSLIFRVRNELPEACRYCYRILGCDWVKQTVVETNSLESTADWNSIAEEVGVVTPNDIVAQDQGICFGAGFRDPQKHRSEVFRWARDQSVLLLAPPTGSSRTLTLDVEPGPALGCEGFVLEIRDRSNRVLARGPIEGHQRLYLTLPLDSSRPVPIVLHVTNQKAERRNDEWRGLDFKVFRCGWSALPVSQSSPDCLSFRSEWLEGPLQWDTTSEAAEIRFGSGWYAVEHNRCEVYRWGRDGAIFQVRAHSRQRVKSLKILLEPAHPDTPQPVRILVRDRTGKTLLRTELTLRSEIRIPLRLRPGESKELSLHTEGANLRRENDPRTLSFRVFEPVIQKPIFAAGPLGFLQRTWHQWRHGKRPPHDESGNPRVEDLPSEKTLPITALHLHTNACGDFTLLAKEHWFALRGYPEFEMYSLHIDSLFCYMAHHAGALEEVLPDPIQVYHIEHTIGSGWTPEGEDKLFRRMQEKGIPVMPYSSLIKWGSEMREKGPIIFNDDSWGLGTEYLPETVVPSRRTAVA